MYNPGHPMAAAPLQQQPPASQHNPQPQAVPLRQQIVDSLFNKVGPDGQREETLITYLKVWEDSVPGVAIGPTDTEGRKNRYLLLAGMLNIGVVFDVILIPTFLVSSIGRVYLHKAKRNSNQTFSKGKTWNLEDMREIRLSDVSLQSDAVIRFQPCEVAN